MPKAVLTGLKKYPVRIFAICAMFDTGGSSGRLRKDYDIVSPGDIRRALIALANTSPAVENLFNYRFQIGELAGHNFANLLITALELSTNNYETTIGELRRILNIKHRVLPISLDKANLYAVLENGQIIDGEKNIDTPKHNGRLGIKRVYTEPEAKAYPNTIKALKDADLIVVGPGDLYSTIAQIFLVKEIPKTVLKSKAKTVYLPNLMTKYGETNGFSVLDFTNQVEKWLGGSFDFILYNNFIPKEKRIRSFKKSHPELVEMVRIDKDLKEPKFIGKNLLYNKGLIEHDSEKVAKALISLI